MHRLMHQIRYCMIPLVVKERPEGRWALTELFVLASFLPHRIMYAADRTMFAAECDWCNRMAPLIVAHADWCD